MTDRKQTDTAGDQRRPTPKQSNGRRVVAVVNGLLAAVGVLVVFLVGRAGSPARTSPSDTGRVPQAAEPGPPGPEGVPLQEGTPLAPFSTAATGQPVGDVQCNSTEQVAYHVHTHLSVYVNGQLRPVPAGIGIVLPIVQETANGQFDAASQCYYWLHVHAQDGVIHIESPAGRTYTLGDFFDLWRQPLSANQAGPASGPVTAFVNGHVTRGDPRDIPLGSREDIQLDVGTPLVPPSQVDWSATSL
jgi:hypothetical protein